jgi:hypothetical protein
LSLDYGFTLDDILCFPTATAEFDRMAAEFAGECKQSVFEYRWAALALRKRARQSKLLARERFHDWDMAQVPQAIALEQCTASAYEHPAVYIITTPSGPLYIGETLDLRARIHQILSTEAWRNFGPESAQIIQISDQRNRYGLQSHLIGQMNPILNSFLLRPTRIARGQSAN